MGFLLHSFVCQLLTTLIFMSASAELLAQDVVVELKAEVEAHAATIAALEKRLNALEQSEIVCIAGHIYSHCAHLHSHYGHTQYLHFCLSSVGKHPCIPCLACSAA
jgi:hypothetical protein